MMKILIVAPYYIPYISGMTILVQRLAEGLVRSGHSVCILTSRHDNGLPAEELMNGVRVVRKRVLFRMQRGAFAPGITSALAGLAKDYDVVNIHAPFFEAGLLGLAARLSGRKYVLSYICDLRMQGSPISLGKAIESLYYFSVKSAARHSEKIIVLSKGYIESSRLKEYAPKSVAVIPPIDTEKFVRVADVSSFEKRYGIGVDDVVVGFLGRLTHEKGVEYLLQAAPRIIEKVPKAKIVVAGEGEKVAGGSKESMKSKLREQAGRLGISDRIVFTGFLDDRTILEFYSRCQVFVLPSIDPLEAFGMVQAEAMLCGCPVVASDMPGIRDPVTLTGFGALARPKDPASIADAVVRVLRNRQSFDVGRESIAGFFGVDKTVKGYEAVFDEVFFPGKTK